MTSRHLGILTIFVGLGLAACGPASRPDPITPVRLGHVQVQRVDVKDEDFAPLVKELLLDPTPSDKRLNALAGVVRHQLLRAGRYYQAGHEEAGLAAASGALLLVRAGELRPEMLEGTQSALLASAEVVARLGDEGRTEAFYELVQGQLDAEGQQEAERHLQALHEWQASVRPKGSMQAAGAAQRSAAKRALVERTPETLEAAQRATIRWIDRAFEESRKDGPPTSYFEQDEHIEFRKAITMGALTMAALYLRDGDAAAAVSAIETEPVASISNQRIASRLNHAANGEADDWAYLFGQFEAAAGSNGLALDADLARAAAWGSAVALYRAEPKEIRSVIPISTLLVEHGMADVAPLVFRDALGAQPDPRQLNWALRLLFQALITAERQHDLALARRVFDNSSPVLELAGSSAYLGRVRPSASDFSYLMGAMESRAGELVRAREHLQSSVQASPTADALRLLAAIDRQRGQTESALNSIRSIISLAKSEGDLIAEAESHLAAYDIHAQLKQTAEAQRSLQEALSRALQAREKARNGGEAAAAERVLADVLEHYGDRDGVIRATARAHDAARNNLRQLTATLLDASRRALVVGDLAMGRRALRRALDADLEPKDLVYVALWVKLLHDRMNAPSDGSVEEALARIERDGSWMSALRDWGKGAISDQELIARASSEVERVEARFYVGTSAHFRGESGETRAQLQQVAKSPTIELIEVRIARELLEPSPKPPKLPSGLRLP